MRTATLSITLIAIAGALLLGAAKRSRETLSPRKLNPAAKGSPRLSRRGELARQRRKGSSERSRGLCQGI